MDPQPSRSPVTAVTVDPDFHQRNLRRYARPLLQWFDRCQRDLPWRKSKTAYRIWISEIMLQQTQVATVIDYFKRFIQRFPDVATLAAADVQEVLRYWEGLGYYRRARQLHRAAELMVEQHGGEFPLTFPEVLALPGIGRYTAGAILSIADDQQLPILEGNTQRLFARLIGIASDPRQPAVQRQLWDFAEKILPAQRPGDFNQALMELGNQVCTPLRPDCPACPLQKLCPTYALNLQEAIPARSARPPVENISEAVLLVSRSRKFLLRKCQPGEWWEGLWDFPRYRLESPLTAVLSEKFAAEFGLLTDLQDTGWQCRHAVTRYRITLRCFRANQVRGRLKPAADRWGWFQREELEGLAMSATGRKISRQLGSII